MKKVLFYIFLLVVVSCPVMAIDEWENPYTYTVIDGQATITYFAAGYSGPLSITNVLGGYPVTAIGGGAFATCSNLTSVVIPASVTSIGDYAFAYCSSLANVTIPTSVTNIRDHTFSYCSSLTSVVVPASVTSIGDFAFSYCSSLTSVAIPASVTAIEDYAFFFCSSLTSVVIPASVTSIGNYAFSCCTSLTSVTVDDANAVYSSIDGVLFNETQTTLIQHPAAKAEAYAIPASVTVIWPYALSYSSNLTSVTIPASVTNIGSGAMACCTTLQRIYFMGNPAYNGINLFTESTNVTVYCLPGTTGWGQTLGGRPVVLWNPTFAEVTSVAGTISCTVTGTPDIPVSFDVTTNLLGGAWTRLYVTNLTAGVLDFRDLDFTSFPVRFYRISGP